MVSYVSNVQLRFGTLRTAQNSAQGDAPAGTRRCRAIVACTEPCRWTPATARACLCPQEAHTMEQERQNCAADPVAISYTLLRQIGLVLDELSAQGLSVWQDERLAWQWAWVGAEIASARGFWALGEAIVDAVATRFPAAFE